MSTIIHRWHRFTQISAVICVICGSCLSGLAVADDLTVAQQELKGTIEAAQTKRMAELDKLKPDLARVNVAVDKANDMAAELQAKVVVIHEEWKQAVSAALKVYRDKERAQQQEYRPPVKGAQILQIGWDSSSKDSSPGVCQEQIDLGKKFLEWKQNRIDEVNKEKTKDPFKAGEIQVKWHMEWNKEHADYQKKWIEAGRKCADRR
jgi:hypothetical protein